MRNSNTTTTQNVILDGGEVASQIVSAKPLVVLNDLTIEDYVLFDHNAENVTVGGDFTIETNGEYEYDNGKKNTTTLNGSGNSDFALYNMDTNGEEQRFWRLVIDKSDLSDTVSLLAGKTGAALNNNNNNTLRIDGTAFMIHNGTLDNGNQSVRLYTDSLINYGRFGVFVPGTTDDQDPNGENDLIKFRPDPFIMVTSDSSEFGNVRLNNGGEIVTFNSDVHIQRIEYRHGRMNLQDNNLVLDTLDINLNNSQADWNNCNGCNSVEDMFITDGNASDGGLTLKITNNGIYTFPIGIGTDGLDVDVDGGNSKYTEVIVNVTNFVDDGYIMINNADAVLGTTDQTGGDILSYYWKVQHSGFTTEPQVNYRFKYYTDDLGGSGNEALFVPGYVQDISPYQRNYENDVSNVDDANNLISIGLDTVIVLEQANYTAGEFDRFVGSPEVYYSRRDDLNTGFQSMNWTTNSSWSTDDVLKHYGAAASDYPKSGDIVIVGYGNIQQPGADSDCNCWTHRINMPATTTVAEIVYDSEISANAKNVRLGRLNLGASETLNASVVSGLGELHVQTDGTSISTLNIDDLGGFISEGNSSVFFNYTGAGAGSGLFTINQFNEYPTIRFYADGANSSTVKDDQFTFGNEVTVTNFMIDGNAAFLVTNDLTVTDSTFIGANKDGELVFDNSATSHTVELNHVLMESSLFTTQRQENRNRIWVQGGGGNDIDHTLIINGNITMRTGSTYADNGAYIDLFNEGDATDNDVILQLEGLIYSFQFYI